MEKVVPVVVVRNAGELNTEYKIVNIVCIDRHFEISRPYCPKQTFDSLKAVGKYVFENIQRLELYTMAHYSADTVQYDILIIDISDNEHVYTYTPEFFI